MKRGVVMSIHKQHAVVMTADGQFLRAPILNVPQIGEEIVFEEEFKSVRAFKPAYWYTGAAAVVLLLFLPLLLFVQQADSPVIAYLTMDINPSIEIGVDHNEKVRELHPLNDDGKLILENLNFRGIKVEKVIASILERANGSHYLDTPNKDIFVTSVMLGDNAGLQQDFESILAGKVDQTLRSLLASFSADSATAHVTTLAVPNELREEAEANGISAGKMALYLMAKDEGYQLELEKLKEQSINKVTDPIGGVKTIVGNASDTSKEKLKQLVIKEQTEKAKQQQNTGKSNPVKPNATPTTNKPVKPGKSASSSPAKSEKPNGNKPKPTTTPKTNNKPTVPNKSKDNIKNDKGNNQKWDDDDRDDDEDKDNKYYHINPYYGGKYDRFKDWKNDHSSGSHGKGRWSDKKKEDKSSDPKYENGKDKEKRKNKE